MSGGSDSAIPLGNFIDFELRLLQSHDTWPLRQQVLRPGRPASASVFPGDEDPGTFHVGVIETATGLIAGIGTFRPENLPTHPPLRGTETELGLWRACTHPFRLRGMAVHPNFRRRGLGELVLNDGERRLQEQGADLLWFNARESAFAFYVASGYTFASDLFDIPDVGPHKVMLKRF